MLFGEAIYGTLQTGSMRIGIEAQRIFREKKHGMDFVALETIRELQKLDAKNDYIIYVNNGPDRACLQETENFKIKVFSGAYPFWEQVRLRAKAQRDRLDVLHCTSNTAPVNIGVPLVITLHDIIYFETNPFFAKGYSLYQMFGNAYRRWTVRNILTEARKVITVSYFEKKRFEHYLELPGEKIEVIYNGVSRHFKPVKDKEVLEKKRQQYQLPEHFFLYLGNTDPKKNTTRTVLAFARYCEKYGTKHKLVVGDLNPDVVQILSKHGYSRYKNEIIYTGYINNLDLPAILSMAGVFLYPSLRESFGIPLLESMACGTPVLTGNTSSMPEVAGEAAYYVDPLSEEEIAEGLHRLSTDEDLRNTLISRGLERVKDFDWKTTAQKTLALYHEIVE